MKHKISCYILQYLKHLKYTSPEFEYINLKQWHSDRSIRVYLIYLGKAKQISPLENQANSFIREIIISQLFSFQKTRMQILDEAFWILYTYYGWSVVFISQFLLERLNEAHISLTSIQHSSGNLVWKWAPSHWSPNAQIQQSRKLIRYRSQLME